MFSGLIPATVTPYGIEGKVDLAALEIHLDYLVGCGVGGVAVNMDTGEGPLMSSPERKSIITLAQGVSAKRPGSRRGFRPVDGRCVQRGENGRRLRC